MVSKPGYEFTSCSGFVFPSLVLRNHIAGNSDTHGLGFDGNNHPNPIGASVGGCRNTCDVRPDDVRLRCPSTVLVAFVSSVVMQEGYPLRIGDVSSGRRSHTLFELHFLQAVKCLDEFVYELHPVFVGPTSGFGCRGTEFESEDGIIEFPATGMRREAETMLAKLIEDFLGGRTDHHDGIGKETVGGDVLGITNNLLHGYREGIKWKACHHLIRIGLLSPIRDPDVIIFGGTIAPFWHDLLSNGITYTHSNGAIYVYSYKGKKMIDAYHPNQRKVKWEVYADSIINDLIKEG